MAKARNKINLTLANDLGYGFAKMCFDGVDQYKIPSTKAYKRSSDGRGHDGFINPLTLDRYIDDYMNHMDTSISSKGLRHDNQQENLVGQAALDSNRHLQSFNVSDSSGKSSTDLALIITLSSIAGYSLSRYYKKYRKLPSTLHVTVKMATALPIVECINPSVKNEYRKRYMSGVHIVKINNFNTPVLVHIKFSQVYVLKEGQASQFAIWCSKPDSQTHQVLVPGLMDSISKYYDMYDAPLIGGGHIDPSLLVSSHLKTLGIDIGEGTTDYAVFNGQHVNDNASNSSNTGYGNLLNEAMLELQQNGYNISDRGHLKQLLEEQSPFKRNRKKHAQEALSHHVSGFVDDVIQHLSFSMKITQNDIDLIYVYGGGSIPLEPYLRKPLLTETRKSNGGDAIPVIFIDRRWAQDMNEIGLQLVLKFE